jgi:predicted metalloprotease
LLALFFGFDPSSILPSDPSAPPTSQTPNPSASHGGDLVRDFVSVVLADTEDTWRAIFLDFGTEYREPKLVLFTGAVRSACGSARAAVGPFYCPADQISPSISVSSARCVTASARPAPSLRPT